MKSRRTIGVIVAANLELGRDILLGVSAYCADHPGATLQLISSSGDFDPEGAKGLELDCIVAFVSQPDRLEALRQICPRVIITSNREADQAPKVINDDVAVGRMGADDLIHKGYPALAYLHPKSLHFSKERLRGFREQAEAADIPLQVLEISNQKELPAILQDLQKHTEPVGIMAATDLHARWLISRLDPPNKFIPAQFGVLGVDNDALERALCRIPLSSIATGGKHVGYVAAETGIRWAEGIPPPDTPIRIRPVGVITRQSTDMLAYPDPLTNKTLQLINEKVERFHDVNAVVKAIGIPRRTLEHRISLSTGRSLGQLLTRARTQKAVKLLAETDLSIKEIAYLVGLSEPRMLSLVFKRETGETPTEFRARSN